MRNHTLKKKSIYGYAYCCETPVKQVKGKSSLLKVAVSL